MNDDLDFPTTSGDLGPLINGERPERARPKARSRRLWLAAGAAAVAIAGVITGVVVLSGSNDNPGGGGQALAGSPAPPGTAASDGATSSDDPPPPSGPPRPGQAPGTIRFAEGGTARLVRRELKPDGELPVPISLDEASWWGVGLGAPHGASLLTGHVNYRGRTGPFAVLWQSQVGQQVTVVDRSGGTWAYRLSRIVKIPKSDLAKQAQELFGQGGPHRLVLVTCGGRFEGGELGYTDNIIVVADLVSRP